MLAFGTIFTLIAIGAWLYALFDSVTTPEDKIRYLQKPLWVLIVLLFFVLGAIAWFFFGRPKAGAAPGQLRTSFGDAFGARTSTKPRRMIAPDDDPEFLRGLNRPRDDPR